MKQGIKKLNWGPGMQNTIWNLLIKPGGYTYMGRNMEVFLDTNAAAFRLEVNHNVGGYSGYYNTRTELLDAVKDLHIYLTEKRFSKLLKGA